MGEPSRPFIGLAHLLCKWAVTSRAGARRSGSRGDAAGERASAGCPPRFRSHILSELVGRGEAGADHNQMGRVLNHHSRARTGVEEARRPRRAGPGFPRFQRGTGPGKQAGSSHARPRGGGAVVHGPRPGQKAALAGGEGPSGLCQRVGLCLRLGGLQQPAWPPALLRPQAACVQANLS